MLDHGVVFLGPEVCIVFFVGIRERTHLRQVQALILVGFLRADSLEFVLDLEEEEAGPERPGGAHDCADDLCGQLAGASPMEEAERTVCGGAAVPADRIVDSRVLYQRNGGTDQESRDDTDDEALE